MNKKVTYTKKRRNLFIIKSNCCFIAKICPLSFNLLTFTTNFISFVGLLHRWMKLSFLGSFCYRFGLFSMESILSCKIVLKLHQWMSHRPFRTLRIGLVSKLFWSLGLLRKRIWRQWSLELVYKLLFLTRSMIGMGSSDEHSWIGLLLWQF